MVNHTITALRSSYSEYVCITHMHNSPTLSQWHSDNLYFGTAGRYVVTLQRYKTKVQIRNKVFVPDSRVGIDINNFKMMHGRMSKAVLACWPTVAAALSCKGCQSPWAREPVSCVEDSKTTMNPTTGHITTSRHSDDWWLHRYKVMHK